MDKLRSAEELWNLIADPHITDEQVLKLLNDHTVRVTQACADAYTVKVRAHGGIIVNSYVDAILAVVQPQETVRERLGRVLWNAQYPNGPWDPVPEMVKEQFCDRAAAVQAELAKIKEEQKV